MTEPVRVSPHEVRESVKSGSALLVCAYSDEEKFKRVHLDGAISMAEFQSRVPTLAKGQEIIFYCA